MKILYLTFYFEPDLCAGSFRNTPLVQELSRQLRDSDHIHVITTMPNRYSTFSQDTNAIEYRNNITIERIKLPQHKSGIIDQALAFRVYFYQALKKAKNREYDLVFASSSRLFTAFLGKTISQKKKLPLYLDIRDIFVDTIGDVFQRKIIQKPVVKLLKRLEYSTFSNASHINLISPGFKSYFNKFPVTHYSFYTNGIDEVFLRNNLNSNPKKQPPYIITYAGNIGEGQGLHKIIPEAAKLLGENYKFVIIGDGGKKQDLIEKINSEDIKNVELIKPMPRDKLIEFYAKSHYLFLHLNSYKAFEKVLPSKVFEYGALNKPMIAGVSGFAAKFIQEQLTNYILFSPGDASAMTDQLINKPLEFKDRKDFKNKFSRSQINKELASSIINTANSTH